LVVELEEELKYATKIEFKSKNDDVADGVSMILELDAYKPSAEAKPEFVDSEDGKFAWFEDNDDDVYKNSTVF
jgi:hypothetical protein